MILGVLNKIQEYPGRLHKIGNLKGLTVIKQKLFPLILVIIIAGSSLADESSVMKVNHVVLLKNVCHEDAGGV